MFILVPLLLVGLAGCSSTGDDTASGGDGAANKEAGLKFAQCMRDNGIPDFQDPKFDENGDIDDMSLPKGVDLKTAQAAQETCQKYLPNGGAAGKINPDDVKKFREYAQCMRENGVPKFPDPDAEGHLQVKAININGPEYKAANEKCAHLTPGGGGVTFEGK
jgi:hypothetical protein